MASKHSLVFLLLGMVMISTTTILANNLTHTTKKPTEKKSMGSDDEKRLHEKLQPFYRSLGKPNQTPSQKKQYTPIKLPQLEKPLSYYRVRKVDSTSLNLSSPPSHNTVPTLSKMVFADLPN